MELDEGIQAFETEAQELLEEMEHALLELENNPEDVDHINSVFRAAHTIKGSSGLFAFNEVVEFTHVVESVLDSVRLGEVQINQELLTLLLDCRDIMGYLVEKAVSGRDDDGERDEKSRVIIKQLETYLGNGTQEDCDKDAAGKESTANGGSLPDEPIKKQWNISLRFGRDVLRNGMDPLSFIRYLGTLGNIVKLETQWGRMPVAEEMDAEECYLDFEIEFISEAGKEAIENVFQFVQDDCEVSIIPQQQENQQSSNESAQATDIPMEQKQPGQETEGNKQVRGKQANESKSIRVSAEKLGQLIDLVGELVISSANTKLLGRRTNDTALIESLENMSRLVEDIRDTGLGLRMVPIGETFNRFRRVVRDLSQNMQKEIELEINGGDKVLDKTVVEKIGDPLMHLVRNSIDHGIEQAELRQQAGKPGKGKLSLNAYHDSGSIVIEVEDDGGGLSRDKILDKALQKGLVNEGQNLSDQEVYRLIFEPGFSTAEQVTDVSGRGVGMDVVRRNIESLRGQVDVESWAGKGTRFSIRLPLTLAIIDGFLVRVGKAFYVIPLDMVEECVELPGLAGDKQENDYINLRGEVLPFIRLGELFQEAREQTRRENIVVAQYAGQKAGLVVDELLGEYQTVIKPLGRIFAQLDGVSGATILGSGEVAMIIDVPELVQQVAMSRNRLNMSNQKLQSMMAH